MAIVQISSATTTKDRPEQSIAQIICGQTYASFHCQLTAGLTITYPFLQ